LTQKVSATAGRMMPLQVYVSKRLNINARPDLNYHLFNFCKPTFADKFLNQNSVINCIGE